MFRVELVVLTVRADIPVYERKDDIFAEFL